MQCAYCSVYKQPRHLETPSSVHLRHEKDHSGCADLSTVRRVEATSSAKSHLWLVVVPLEGQARPEEEQEEVEEEEEEEGGGEAEGPPGERTWTGLKGVFTLVAI